LYSNKSNKFLFFEFWSLWNSGLVFLPLPLPSKVYCYWAWAAVYCY